jgi:hypothetical protein
MASKEIQFGLMALAAAAFAGETHLHREGTFWVEVEKGATPVSVRGSIRISTIGGNHQGRSRKPDGLHRSEACEGRE